MHFFSPRGREDRRKRTTFRASRRFFASINYWLVQASALMTSLPLRVDSA